MPRTGVGGTSASPPSSQHPGHAPSFLLLQHTQPFQPQGLCTPCYLNTTSPGSFPPILQASVPAVHPEGLFSDPITSSLLTYTRSSLCLPFALLSLEDIGVCICMSPVSPTQKTIIITRAGIIHLVLPCASSPKNSTQHIVGAQ